MDGLNLWGNQDIRYTGVVAALYPSIKAMLFVFFLFVLSNPKRLQAAVSLCMRI